MTLSMAAAPDSGALRSLGWVVALCAGLASPASAAPTTVSTDAEPVADGPSSSGIGAATSGISTGQRHLDLLLEQQGAARGAAAPVGAASSAASMPRQADLRQALRVEAIMQERAKAGEKAQEAGSTRSGGPLLGGGLDGQATLREGEAADPTMRRTWEGGNGHPPPASEGSKVGAPESPAMQALRDAIDFLRTHRIELFAGLALVALGGVLVRLFSRTR